MQINNYWWEEELEKLMGEYAKNEYMGNAEIKLFILKTIEAEKEDKTARATQRKRKQNLASGRTRITFQTRKRNTQ